MRPSLAPVLLPDRRREACAPSIARVMLDDVLDGGFADEGVVETHVVLERVLAWTCSGVVHYCSEGGRKKIQERKIKW